MARKAATRGSIDRGTIVKVALKLLDRYGIEGVSTRKVAEALGIAGPSLYWHFSSKRVLLDHMAEAMLADAMAKPHPVHSQGVWRRWFKASGHAIGKAA